MLHLGRVAMDGLCGGEWHESPPPTPWTGLCWEPQVNMQPPPSGHSLFAVFPLGACGLALEWALLIAQFLLPLHLDPCLSLPFLLPPSLICHGRHQGGSQCQGPVGGPLFKCKRKQVSRTASPHWGAVQDPHCRPCAAPVFPELSDEKSWSV